MATTNDITGDSIRTKGHSNLYGDNFDRIFGKKKPITWEDMNEEHFNVAFIEKHDVWISHENFVWELISQPSLDKNKSFIRSTDENLTIAIKKLIFGIYHEQT